MKEQVITKIVNQTFDEHDVRRFLRIFTRSKDYPTLAAMEKLCKRRQKDQLLKAYEISQAYKNRYYDILDTRNTVLYETLCKELKEYSSHTNISMNEESMKEIILCIYSLMQFTRISHGRLCLLQNEHTISLAEVHHNIITIISTIENVEPVKTYEQGLISDLVKVKRMDGKLVVVNYADEIVINL